VIQYFSPGLFVVKFADDRTTTMSATCFYSLYPFHTFGEITDVHIE